MSLQTKAPAKINLNLHVTGKRDDGYHLLESVITFADLADELVVEKSEDISLEITGPFSESLSSEENLVLQAAKILCEKYKINEGAKLSLVKNIPVGAGLGGGSADAAAAISLLCDFWNIEISDEEKYAIGISLGADVPVCQMGSPAFVRGIGEQLLEIKNLPEFYAVLVNPRVHVPTATIFQKGFAEYSETVGLPEDRDSWSEFLRNTKNDLEENALAFSPEIGGVLEVLYDNSEKIISRMSGSGSTCFALFDEKSKAGIFAEQIQKDHPDWWVVSSVLFK